MATIPIEVIVQDAEAPIVPSEDGTNINTNTEAAVAVPDTGGSGSNIFTGSASSIILPAILLVLAIGSIVAILIHKYHKQKRDKTTRKEKLAVAASSTIAVLAVTVLIGNLVIPATKAATSDIEDGITPAEDKVSIVVTRDGGSVETSIESTATITSTSDFGYKVLLSMAGGVETSSLYLNGDEASEHYIASVEAENEEGAELTDNTWGFALEEGANYTAVPLADNAATVAEGDEAVEDENLSIYYGVKVSNDLPVGTYSGGEVEYTLEAKEPTLPITYMQDFATLSEEDKAALISSMPEGYQFTLKDNRDQKDYFISKLADGNVWMTQNLDLDLDSTHTYTSSDTDIPSDWTPSASTVKNASSWTSSHTAPSSYDPGERYWNGDFIVAGQSSGSIEDMTNESGDPHYHLGNYYNWTAAIAVNNSGAYNTDLYDVNQSICPAGWRMSTYSGDKSWQNLINISDITAGRDGNSHKSPYYFVYASNYNNGVSGIGSGAYYWLDIYSTGTYMGAKQTYTLETYSGGHIDPTSLTNSMLGESVRCVAR